MLKRYEQKGIKSWSHQRGWKWSPGAANLKMVDWDHGMGFRWEAAGIGSYRSTVWKLNRLSSLSKRSGKRVRHKTEKGKDHSGPQSPLLEPLLFFWDERDFEQSNGMVYVLKGYHPGCGEENNRLYRGKGSRETGENNLNNPSKKKWGLDWDRHIGVGVNWLNVEIFWS